MKRSVVIDCFPGSTERYRGKYATVVVDVIRATTTATTALGMGRRVFPAQTTDDAFVLAETLKDPLMVGELGGNMPYGFDLTNSPAQIAERTDIHRPMVLVSSSGTQLMLNAKGGKAVYIACFRNLSAVANHVANTHKDIAIIGAGTRGQFRREDQMACAWIGERLIASGYQPGNSRTEEYISRWKGSRPEVVLEGRSADYLRRSGQESDLEFILDHIDDLDIAPQLKNGEFLIQ